MNKLCTAMLTLAALLGISFSANAQLTTNFTWDRPGSVEIYVGNTTEDNKASIPDGATSYTATWDDTWGYTYVRAAEGYLLIDATCGDDGKTVKPSTGSTRQISINMSPSQHNGHTVHINVAKIEYDGTIEVNLVSAGEVTARLGGIRDIELKGGKQNVKFSTQYESTIRFSANDNQAEAPYIKKNGENVEWPTSQRILNSAEIAIADGDKFEIKYNNQAPSNDADKEKFTVTLEADQMAMDAISMMYIYNNNKVGKMIAARDAFEVEDGDVFRIIFNARDYEVAVNGVDLSPTDECASYVSDPVTANTTIKISAKERVYGTAMLSVSISDPQGVVLRNGSIDGPVIDLSQFESADEAFMGESFKNYQIEVSLKNPKIFVSNAEGWYVYQCGYGNPKDKEAWEPMNVAITGYSSPLHIWTHKITMDKRLVVVLKGNASKARLKDAHRTYELTVGYNEFEFDPIYSGSFAVVPIKEGEESFSVFLNYAAVGVDANEQYSGITPSSDAVIHIFSDTPASKKHKFTVENEAPTDPEITYDRVLKAKGNEFSAYVGAEISIKPAAGYTVKVDDEEIPSADGVFSFVQEASGANTSHTISIVAKTQGIGSVGNDAKSAYTVVGLNGRIILKNADYQQVRQLPTGIYIINGQKVLVSQSELQLNM